MIRKRKKVGNFTQIDNHSIKNPRLSYKAKGLLITMMSVPDDWEFNRDWLISQSTDGREAVDSGLQALEAEGYLIRIPKQLSNGKLCGWEWLVDDVPMDEGEILTELRVFRNTVKPSFGKSAPTKTNITKTNITKTKAATAPKKLGVVKNLDQEIDPPHPPGGDLQTTTSLDEKQNDPKLRKQGTGRPNKPPHSPPALPAWLPPDLWDAWTKHCKEKKNPLTPITIQRQIAKLSKYPPEVAIRAIEEALDHGWTGIFPESVKPRESASQPATGAVVGDSWVDSVFWREYQVFGMQHETPHENEFTERLESGLYRRKT